MLSPRSRQVYRFLRDYMEREGQAPLLEEIADALGIRSKGVIHRYLQTLEKEGLIERLPGRHRGIRLAGHLPAPRHDGHPTLPLLGRIAAGRPIEAIPEQEELDVAALLSGPGMFALKIVGDSMIDAGIRDGDWAVVRSTESARNGQVVVALVDREEATLKYFQRNPDASITLIPANPTMAPMTYPPERVRVQGVLAGLVRSY